MPCLAVSDMMTAVLILGSTESRLSHANRGLQDAFTGINGSLKTNPMH